MGYLDNDTIVVDAILTKHGRKLLADGHPIRPSHFSLSDDGIDYKLFDITNAQGDYDKAILNMPVLEATTRTVAVTEAGTDAAMKYPLIDALDDTVDTISITGVPVSTETVGSFDYIVISPVTENLNVDEQYVLTLPDDTYIDVFADGDTINVDQITYEGN